MNPTRDAAGTPHPPLDATGVWQVGLAAAIVVSWFLLPAIRFELPGALGLRAPASWTAWETLRLYTTPGSMHGSTAAGRFSHGFGSILALLALALPFLVPFWSNARARLLNAAPLVFLIAAEVKSQWDLLRARQMATDLARDNPFVMPMAEELGRAFSQAISVGIGGYALVLLSTALAILPFVGIGGGPARPVRVDAVPTPIGRMCPRCATLARAGANYCDICQSALL